MTDFSKLRQWIRGNPSHRDYCQQLLEQTLEATGGHAVLLWDATREPFRLLGEQSSDTRARLPMTPEHHQEMLTKVAEQKRSVFVRLNNVEKKTTGEANKGDATLPLVLLAPIHRSREEHRDVELLEVIIDEPESQEVEQRLLASITTIAEIAASYDREAARLIDRSDVEDSEDVPGQSPSDAVELSFDRSSVYLNALHASIDRKTTCANIANETRRFLDCDRVSVACRQNGKFRLFAISGQASVNRRSGTTKLLEKLTQRLLLTGQPFWYPAISEIPPQVSEVLDEYLSVSATRSLIVEPVFERADSAIEDPDSHDRKTNRVIGGIVYEHCNHQWTPEGIAPVIQFTREHSGNALRNATRHQGLFLYPLWNLLGKSKILTAPRILPKTLLALAAAVILGLFLSFWQTDFYVMGEGVIVPARIQRVFCQADGVVQTISVEHGTEVKAGQVLVQLTSEDLDLRRQETEGRLAHLQKRMSILRDERLESRVRGSGDAPVAQDNLQSMRSQIESLENQLVILDSMAKKMAVRSPMAGQVITWDLSQRLLNRPVFNGEMLMEVADTHGPWKLELELEDRRVGHLMRAMAASETGRLPIRFLLAADPSKRLVGEVTEIGRALEVAADNKQILKVSVEIDTANLPVKHIRTGVVAQIICGKSSIGYLWLHDIQEFFEKNVFFPFAT